MRRELEEKLRRFEELEEMLADPAVLADPARMSAVAREHGLLAKLAPKYRRFKELNQQIREAQEMLDGPDLELRELAEAEIAELKQQRLKQQRDRLWDDLLELTIGGEDAARRRCVLEIRAGTGGEEAALFARDLFHMYRRYAESKGWKFEVLDMHPT